MNKFKSLEAMINGETPSKGIENKYMTRGNYVRSKALTMAVDQIFKSNETYNFYMQEGEYYLNRFDADEFALEDFFNKINRENKLVKALTSARSSESYKMLSSKDRESVDNLYSRHKTKLNGMVKSMESGGLKAVGQSIKNAIKKLIIAIANFFKAIGTKIKQIFSNREPIQQLYSKAQKVVASNPKLSVQVPHTGGFNKSFSSDMNKLTTNITKSITTLNSYVNKYGNGKFPIFKPNLFGNPSANLKTNKSKIVYGTNKVKPGTMTGKKFLESIKSMVSFDYQSSLNKIKDLLKEMASALSKLENVYNQMESTISSSTKENSIAGKAPSYKYGRQIVQKLMAEARFSIKEASSISSYIFSAYTGIYNALKRITATNKSVANSKSEASKTSKQSKSSKKK